MSWPHLLLALGTIASANADCGDEEKKDPLYKMVEACETAKALSSPDAIANALAELPKYGYCSMVPKQQKEGPLPLLKELCADPNGVVCKLNQGHVIDANCNFTELNPDEIRKLPSYVEIKCAYEAKEKAFLTAHSGECPSYETESACFDFLRAKYSKELAKIERDTAYTSARSNRVLNSFKRLKAKYIELIKGSKLIAQDRKAALVDIITGVQLNIPPVDKHEDCTNTQPTGPSSVFYFAPRTHHITFCIGAIASVDYMDDQKLMWLMGHELSHSIDPCGLQKKEINERSTTFSDLHGDPDIVSRTYPGLIPCLRGGKGPDGCEESVLHCNDSAGVKEFCEKEGLGPNTDTAICNHYTSLAPNCPWGVTGTPDYTDASKYRSDGRPIDQISESFSDYFGAEVTGAMAEEDVASGKMTQVDQINGLTGVAGFHAHLHGPCLEKNTNDEHAPGFIRMNRIVLGSKRLQRGLGCPEGPPKTPGANMSCQGL